MPEILTTIGLIDESLLEKRTIYEDRPQEWVIAVEYRLLNDCTPSPGCDGLGNQGELVRRDCHVVLKNPSAVADSIAGGM